MVNIGALHALVPDLKKGLEPLRKAVRMSHIRREQELRHLEQLEQQRQQELIQQMQLQQQQLNEADAAATPIAQ